MKLDYGLETETVWADNFRPKWLRNWRETLETQQKAPELHEFIWRADERWEIAAIIVWVL